ncbi:MAG: ATP-binding protein [Terriglobales bacterium]
MALSAPTYLAPGVPRSAVSGQLQDHQVWFYDEDAELIAALAARFGPALSGGGNALMVSTTEHAAALEASLASDFGLDIHQLRRAGRYRHADAAATLDGFMVGARPQAAQFQHVIPALIAAGGVPAAGTVVFGEMVALLWAAGKRRAAVELERLWNQLAGTCDVTLLCAYPVRAFSRPSDRGDFRRICAEHRQVVRRLPRQRAGIAAGFRALDGLQQQANLLEGQVQSRRAAEQRARQAEHAAREAEALAYRAEREARRDAERATAVARRLEAVIASAAVGVALRSPDGRYLLANGAFCAITGYSEAELRAMDCHDLTHPDDRGLLQQQLDVLLSGAAPSVAFEKRYLRKNQRIVWVRNSMSLVRDAAGQPQQLVVLCEDVTARREAENLLLVQSELLRIIASGSPLEECLNALCAAVSLFDPHARACVLTVNDERTTFTGMVGAGAPAPLATLVPGTAADASRSGACGEAVERGEHVVCSDIEHAAAWPAAWRNACLASGLRGIICTPVPGREGPVAAFALWFEQARTLGPRERDLSDFGAHIASIAFERDRAGRQREQSELALQQSEQLAAAGRIAATVAHEINNPLQAVCSLLFLTGQDASLSPAARAYLERASAEVARAGLVARSTLSFYRGQAAAWLDVTATVGELLDVYAYKLERRRVTLQRDWPEAAWLWAPAGELRQVVSNLVLNAMDALPALNGRLRVRVRCQWDGVRVSVADNGPGITAEKRTSIFAPFFTTKAAQGTGLGLWICREILTKHGGRIQIRSRTSGATTGTVFSIFWPNRNATSSPPVAPAPTSNPL